MRVLPSLAPWWKKELEWESPWRQRSESPQVIGMKLWTISAMYGAGLVVMVACAEPTAAPTPGATSVPAVQATVEVMRLLQPTRLIL